MRPAPLLDTDSALDVEVTVAFAPEGATTPVSNARESTALLPSTKKRALSSNSNNSSATIEGVERIPAASASVPGAPCATTNQELHSDEESTSGDQGIDPHDLMLLKVIGRGTFAQQVALAKHTRTQSMYVVKTLDKRNLIQRKQVVHTLNEKKVLELLGGRHPFIVRLYSAFQTERDLNFVLEYCQGGELFYHLQQQQQQKFDERATMFYAAEVLCALKELHAKGIVYRDLKPENVLLDAEGHVKLADFGFAKQEMAPGARTYSFCGSPEYLSPEMVNKDGHGIETDMWSFGCFCYELLTGSPPFQHNSSLGHLFDTIRRGRVWYPPYLSPSVVSLLEGLLRVNPKSRLTAVQAMEHDFFQTLDWSDLLQRHVVPPIVPVCEGRDCTQNFDDGFTKEPVVSLALEEPQSCPDNGGGEDLHKRLRISSSSSPDIDAGCKMGFYQQTDPLVEFANF
ncbi:Agc protein kinase, partial [Globisporangium splendens]